MEAWRSVSLDKRERRGGRERGASKMSKALLITRSFSQNSNLSRSFVVLLAVPLVSEELWVHLQLEEERKETKRGKRVRCLGPLHVHETGKAQKRKKKLRTYPLGTSVLLLLLLLNTITVVPKNRKWKKDKLSQLSLTNV